MTLQQEILLSFNAADEEAVSHCIWKDQVYEQMDYKSFIHLLSLVLSAEGASLGNKDI